MKKCCWLLILLLSITMLKAQSLIQEAIFHLRSAEYSLALEKGLLAFEKDSAKKRFEIARIIAQSYEKMGMNEEALPWYERLIHPKNKIIDDIYHYAVCLKSNGKYLPSIWSFKKYKLLKGTKPVDDLLQSCRKALNQSQDSTVWKVTNFSRINSAAADFGLMETDQGFWISSDRASDSLDQVQYKWTGQGFQKIFYAYRLPGTDSLRIDTITTEINQYYSHAGALALSPTGDTLFYTGTAAVNKRPPKVNKKEDQLIVIRNGLYYSVKDSSGEWQKPKAFLYNQQSSYHVMHSTIDRTGRFLVFASDQPGGYGGMDLYYSVKERDSFWSPPCNLGSVVNSMADEVFPVFDSLGRLRFSSNRFAGRGGLDIYETENKIEADTVEGILVHLPYPFNSASDDFLLTDGKQGKLYFSSNRPGGKGMDDIYEVEQIGKTDVKLFFAYNDSADQQAIQIQPFVGLRDLRTGQEWIQVLADKNYFTLPVQENMQQQVLYYARNGKKFEINDTIRYHPSYPKYGMIKRYPSLWNETEDEKEPEVKQVAIKPASKRSTPKKKK